MVRSSLRGMQHDVRGTCDLPCPYACCPLPMILASATCFGCSSAGSDSYHSLNVMPPQSLRRGRAALKRSRLAVSMHPTTSCTPGGAVIHPLAVTVGLCSISVVMPASRSCGCRSSACRMMDAPISFLSASLFASAGHTSVSRPNAIRTSALITGMFPTPFHWPPLPPHD